MSTAHRRISICSGSETLARRRLTRRSALGLTGAALVTLLGGCGWGDDDDDNTSVGDDFDDGLQGAEDPGENPGINEESGIEDDVVGDPDDDLDTAATDEPDD